MGLFDTLKEVVAATRIVGHGVDVFEYLDAPTFEAAVQMVRDNPRLLTPEAIVALEYVASNEAVYNGSVEVEERSRFLTQCVAEGSVDAALSAFREQQQPRRMALRLMDFIVKLVEQERLDAGILLASHPELTSPEADELMGQLLDKMGEDEVSEPTEHARDLLRRAASLGSDVVISEMLEVAPEDVPALLAQRAFWVFGEFETWESSREWLAEHPVLLEESAEDALTPLIEQMRGQVTDTDLEVLEVHLAVLRLARVDGIDAAFASKGGPKQLSSLGLMSAAVREARSAMRASNGRTVDDLLAELDAMLEPTRARLVGAVDVDLEQAATMAWHAELAYRSAEPEAVADALTPIADLTVLGPYSRAKTIPEHLTPAGAELVAAEFAAQRSAGYVATYSEHAVVAIRGTQELADLAVSMDLQAGRTGGHLGYALLADWLAEPVASILEANPRSRVLVTGHSMGGAVAAALGHALEVRLNLNEVEVWTFGAPVTLGARVDTPVTTFRVVGDMIGRMLTDFYPVQGRLREYLLTQDGIYADERSRAARMHEIVEAVRAAAPTHPQPRLLRMVLARARDHTLSISDSALLGAGPHTYFPRPSELAARHAIATHRRFLDNALARDSSGDSTQPAPA